MRAAVTHEIPGKMVIADVLIDAPAANEVLIRTSAVGLCHSDLHILQGISPLMPPTPAVLGHESAGVVEAVGADVSSVRPGDHVVTCMSAFCGSCDNCYVGRTWLCSRPELTRRGQDAPPRLSLDGQDVFSMWGLASFAEQLLVHENAVVKISHEMPLDVASLLGCGVITGVGAVINAAEVKPGTSVAVIGCGGVGLNCIQGARIAGAGKIIAIDVDPFKLELSRRFGATMVIDARTSGPVGAVKELTDGGVDHAFEVIGLVQTVKQAMQMTRPGGLATILGVLPGSETVEIGFEELRGSRRVQGSALGNNRFRVDIPMLVELYLGGRLQLDELISKRISLDEINEGYDLLAAGGSHVARTVIDFG